MSNRHRDKGKLPAFVALFRHTIKSPAWKAASVGARAAVFELKSNYNTRAQNGGLENSVNVVALGNTR